MRLLNVRSGEIAAFPSSERPPPYAALSHLHGPEEISYRQWMTQARAALKAQAGYFKVKRARVQAISDGLEWVYVYGLCVDGDSAAEEAEAANSAWRRFADARVCYAYLEDIAQPVLGASLADALRASRWFARAWTLVELLACADVVFFSTGWEVLGTRQGLSRLVAGFSGIDELVLAGARPAADLSVAARMSWAAGRKSARAEDVAYSLMGLFGVAMPLLYGEGRRRAFWRLQEEILRRHPLDHTLFAWGEGIVRQRLDRAQPGQLAAADGADALLWKEAPPLLGLLADSPDQFAGSGDLVAMEVAAETFYYGNADVVGNGPAAAAAVLPSPSGQGVLVELPMLEPEVVLYPWHQHRISQLRWGRLGILFCRRRDDPHQQFAVALTPTGPATYGRTRELVVGNFEARMWQRAERSGAAAVLVSPDRRGVPALGHGDVVIRRWVVGNNEELLTGAFPDTAPRHRFSARENVLRTNGSGASGRILWSISALTDTETLVIFITRQQQQQEKMKTGTAGLGLGATTVALYPLSTQIAAETVDADGTTWLPHPGGEAETLALADSSGAQTPYTHLFKPPSDTWISPGVGAILPMVLVRVDRVWLVEDSVAVDVVDLVAPYPAGSPAKGTLPSETFPGQGAGLWGRR